MNLVHFTWIMKKPIYKEIKILYNNPELKMNTKIIKSLFLTFVAAFLLCGCADTINSPVTNAAIKITVYKPLSSDTINCKGQEVIYDLTTDKGIKFIELYVNGTYVSNFFPSTSGAKPVVKITLDSTTYMNQRISYQLKYYDTDNQYVDGTVFTNVLVLGDRIPPYTPFALTMLKLSSTSYNLSWKDTSSGEVIHEVWRKTSTAPDFSLYLNIPSGTNNINDDYVDPNQIYYYEVRGQNGYGYSNFSTVINSIGAGGSINLPPPRLLTAVATRTNVVKLTWQNYSTLQNYFKVERKGNYGTYTSLGIVSKNTTSFKDSASGLVAGGQYWYRIKAVSGSDSSWSNEMSVTTPSIFIPVAQITSLANPSPGKVTIKFNVNNDPWVDYSLIERKTGSSGTWAQIAQIESWVTSYDDTTVVAGNTYYYRIRKYSVNYDMFSDYSNEMSIYTIL